MISLHEVSKSFGGIHAVENCTFDVPAGSITGLIGPNGAGKTTLFNIIAGFLRADHGRIVFDELDITNHEPHELFALGLVRTFQIPHEFSRMTVLENLLVVPGGQSGERLLTAWTRWAQIKRQEREIRKRAEQTLEFLNLIHVREELAGNLSGGQKKLLELGRAMMSGAKTILLDEPGAGVNRTLLGQLSDRIKELNRKQEYTFCIIEHDMDLIAELCDPVVVMVQGSVLTQGTMDEIRRDPEVIEAYFGGGQQQNARAG